MSGDTQLLQQVYKFYLRKLHDRLKRLQLQLQQQELQDAVCHGTPLELLVHFQQAGFV